MVRLGDLPGDLRLIYFGFMNCPDVCNESALSIGTILKSLEANDPETRARLTNVFVTLDPEDDVIDGEYNELGGYMEVRYGGQGVALRPRNREQAVTMAHAFGVRVEYREDDFFTSGYTVDHSDLIFLTDRVGRILTYYPGPTPPRAMAYEISQYAQQQ